MDRWPTRSAVERVRARYKTGTRIELIEMDDPQAPPAGTCGTVIAVDDIGSLIVNWDNGCGLNAIPGKDRFRIITEESERGD